MNFSRKRNRYLVAHAVVTLALAHLAVGTAVAQAPQDADGEPGAPGCYAVAPTRLVDVAIEGGETTRGTLTCLSQSQATLVHDGVMLQVPLSRIQRIRTPADPVWDGAAKGAVIPLIFWAVFCQSCNAEPFLRASLFYGFSGLVADAIDTKSGNDLSPAGSGAVGWLEFQVLSCHARLQLLALSRVRGGRARSTRAHRRRPSTRCTVALRACRSSVCRSPPLASRSIRRSRRWPCHGRHPQAVAS